jgi:hypothetical protein
MYSDGERAWWNPFSGSRFYNDFHAALDIAAVLGTAVRAAEAGTVIESYFDSVNGGGHKIRVQIRPGVYYCDNHMSARKVNVGARVTKGQIIGLVGATGAAFGAHDHFWVGIDDTVGTSTWPTLYNPRLFLPGERLANDPRIQPLSVVRYLVLNGPGINIRTSPDLDVGSTNIYAWSAAGGIYRGSTRIGALTYKFKYIRVVPTDDGEFFEVTGFSRKLYIFKTLAHFV